MNLASNCRYRLWFPLLCRKWVWLSWSLSSLEWKSTARDVLLSQQMLPAIKRAASDTFFFQQDNAPSHHAMDTIKQLQQETPDFIGPDLSPPNSSDLNLMDYKYGVGCYAAGSVWISYESVSMSWSCASLTSGTACSRTLLMRPSTAGENSWEHAFWIFIASACD